MNAFFFGTSAFAVPSLRAAARYTTIEGVVTQPDRPAGRGHKLVPTPVKAVALELGLPVYTPARLIPFADDIAARAPDVLIVASYGRILPARLLALARSGIAFNVHPSLLPLYRGATPLQSAIRDGRTETGVTIIAMDAGMDTGDVLVAEPTPLGADESYGELHDRLAMRGAELLGEAIERLRNGRLTRTPQAALGIPPAQIEATLTRPIAKEDLVLDWSWPAKRIVDAVRAFSPSPAARAELGGQPVKVLAARLAAPGESGVTADGGYVERAGDGRDVVVLRLIPPNRGPLSGADFARTRIAV